MFLDSKNWKDVVKKAKNYKAVGQDRIYLDRQKNLDYPWDFVTKVEPGNLHRYSTHISVSFTAKHKSGLEFQWSVDYEPHSASGTGTFKIDTDLLKKVGYLVPASKRADFLTVIGESAKAVEKQADEYQNAANGLYTMSLQMKQI